MTKGGGGFAEASSCQTLSNVVSAPPLQIMQRERSVAPNGNGRKQSSHQTKKGANQKKKKKNGLMETI
jgi:hypothetical protein